MPKRGFESVEEFERHVEGAGELIFDGTEQGCERPFGHDNQKVKYSGKQKGHTDLAMVLSDKSTWIYYVSGLYKGSRVDYGVFKEGFPPGMRWFSKSRLVLDLGFYGVRKDYEAAEIMIGHKRPRKSGNNPKPKLSKEKKDWNRRVSREGIYVEHAIGKMKTYRILKNRCRMKCDYFKSKIVGICAGIWNYKLLLKY
jgi:hypothetical protein